MFKLALMSEWDEGLEKSRGLRWGAEKVVRESVLERQSGGADKKGKLPSPSSWRPAELENQKARLNAIKAGGSGRVLGRSIN